MNLFRGRLGIQPTILLVLLLASLMAGEVLAQAAPTTTDPANTAADTATTATNTDGTTAAATSAQTTDAPSTDNSLPPLTTSTSSSDTLPSLTTSTASSASSASSTSSSLTYTIPVATVPPTANAPYMRQSNLPEGTVFIAVGAALGFVGLSVLAWRAMVAWSINRSVRRAAMEQAQLETKTLLNNNNNKRKSRRHSRRRSHRHHDGGNSVSMEKLGPSHRHSHMAGPKSPGAQSSLFYSPTASAGMPQAANRTSTYLPAGYYSTGAAAPGGHNRNLGPSPPGSPSLPPSSGPDGPPGGGNRTSHLGASSSTVNLNVPPQGRAPSAYLEDLFENHTAAPGGT
ncbi:hypothetical protein VTN77DRAFT_1719 [Rasamsonia byssochlamydoides]|uniref:uncharacterized protein n=1 Tax=Rasamsonia byssochlamydoides TaxID=89139 RepID=UPI0037430329